ncbi:uncharacterized protein LOC124420069, partial [Lucilia cuprina]|uniref:uncharacterized protein LOC124420069 n=1 Tax=Lucilia cuprina TaxID=7375 RepID=UPI001F054875
QILSKPEALAQSKVLMECKVAIKNVESSVCRMTGEKQDKLLDEVASMLPLKSVEAVGEVEQKIESPEFCQAMITYFHKLKGTSEDVSCVIRAVLTDDLLEKYNWEGRWGKQALAKLSLFQKVLQVVFNLQGSLDFEKSIKKAVEKSHHRQKQKKYLKKLT